MLGKGLRERDDLYLASSRLSSSSVVKAWGDRNSMSSGVALGAEGCFARLICAMTCGWARGKESPALPIFTCLDPGTTTITVSPALGPFEGVPLFVVPVLLPPFTLAKEAGYSQVEVSVLMLRMDCAHLAGGRV